MNGRDRTLSAWPAHVIAVASLLLIALQGVAEIVVTGQAQGFPFAVTLMIFLGVGWMLASQLPRHPLGWLIISVPALFASTVPFFLVGHAVLDTAPPLAAWLLWYSEGSWAWLLPVGILFTQIPLRFPDGRLPSPHWRWFSWFTIAAILTSSAMISTAQQEVETGVTNPAYIPGVIDNTALVVAVFAGLLSTSILGSIASLFVRYHRAGAVERAQLRWVLWGSAIPAVLLVLTWLAPGEWGELDLAVSLSYGLIPVCIGVAVLRYHLYDIDRIISRTAAYAIVTALVVGVYALVVTSVTWLWPAAPAVAVALATLAAAALFLPALRWTRRRVDRRFDRARYDAQRIVEQFGEQLRTGADPHTASIDLTDAVSRTLQPSAVGLWLAKGPS